ncbi:MAG: DUF4494 domain-containing protein [Microscillaceae bacterium]|jgi:hypothetical protein|nr:DUF4494 domain-containing protein [Microscillaceae bacterium]
MKNWFICTVKYTKEDEKGNVKKISETYLVDALSYTEAEARIYQELGSIIRGEFQISDLRKSNLIDIFHFPDAETWYKCKVVYSTMDEKSEKEKKVTNNMLVSAHNIKQAYERIEESLKTMLVPYQITSIVVSNYLEVFVYEGDASANERIPENLKPLAKLEELV